MANDVVHHFPLEYLDRPDSNGNTESARLTLRTGKGLSGGITSDARVGFSSAGVISVELFGDFYKLLRHERAGRVTQKAIHVQHSRVFTAEVIAGIQTEVSYYYAARASKNAIQMGA